MAYIDYNGKKRKVLAYNENNHIQNIHAQKISKIWNGSLYVEGDRPGSIMRVSVLRSRGVDEDPETKKQNDSWFKAYRRFRAENPKNYKEVNLWRGSTTKR